VSASDWVPRRVRHSGGAREAILAAIRRTGSAEAALPDLPRSWRAGAAPPDGRPADPASHPLEDSRSLARRFAAMLALAGGTSLEVDGVAGFVPCLPDGASPRRGIVSCVPGLPVSTLTIGPDASRQLLDQVGLAIVPGRFGVAENAAVWVDERDLPHRALPFVAEHLVIVLPKREIVADMHEAYRRLRPPLPGYGTFVSGPSKTADIEQALVIGAQGPKSLAVLLV